MMGGLSGDPGWGAMMRSGEWSCMTGGRWRAMSHGDWQRRQRRWMGAGATHGGWSAGALVAVTLGGALLVALAGIGALLVLRRPSAARGT
jgi:hypothetical protein